MKRKGQKKSKLQQGKEVEARQSEEGRGGRKRRKVKVDNNYTASCARNSFKHKCIYIPKLQNNTEMMCVLLFPSYREKNK